MSWLNNAYPHPTQAQRRADIALALLISLKLPCTCEYGECPKEHYFPWPDDNTSIPKGTLLPSYAPVTHTCVPCQISSILGNIIDPEDRAGSFT